MEDIGIKKNIFADAGAVTRDKATSLTELATSFQNLVSKSGGQFDTKLGTMLDHSAISSLLKSSAGADYRQEVNPYKNDQDQNVRADRTDHSRDREQAEHTRTERPDAPRPERTDTQPEPRNEGPDRKSGSSENDDGDTYIANTGTQGNDDGVSSAASEDQTHVSENSETGTNAEVSGNNAQNDQSKGQNESVGTINVASEATQLTGPANLDLAALLTGGQTVGEQAKNSGTVNVGDKDVVLGNMASASKQSTAQGQTGNQNHILGQNTQTATQQTKTPEDIVKAATVAQQQANELAKTIGGAQKTVVNASVTDDGETLTSKPTSSLVTGTVLASANNKGQTQGNTQAAGNTANSTQNTAQVVSAHNQATQAQQTTNQTARLQAATTGPVDGKGGPLGGQGSQITSATAGTGNSDTGTGPTTATNSTEAGQQAQQNQKALKTQTGTAGKPATSANAVTEQISVKITKAIQSGSDRISIQLKPAELGRVDVKMEVGLDGRVLAVVTADNKDTLDLLKRDSGELQRALQDSGLQLGSSDLSFNLRGGDSDHTELEGHLNQDQASGEDVVNEEDILNPAFISSQNTDISKGRVDVKA